MARRQFNVQNIATGRWLYDWVEGADSTCTYPVWTHDRDKALVLDRFKSAVAVSTARSSGFPGAVRVPVPPEAPPENA